MMANFLYTFTVLLSETDLGGVRKSWTITDFIDYRSWSTMNSGLGKCEMRNAKKKADSQCSCLPVQPHELCSSISIQRKPLHCCSTHPVRPKALFGKLSIDIVTYFNSSKKCSTFSSSDLRKSLTFCAAAFSGACCWPNISEIFDEPPPFHARI